MSTVRRRYTLVIDLDVDADRFSPNEVPDEMVAIENLVDDMGGTMVDAIVGDGRAAPVLTNGKPDEEPALLEKFRPL